MKHFVYLLISFHKGKILSYVGYTNNVKKRLKLHNDSKGAKFTKGKFWKLIYKKEFDSKSNAMRYEYYLKSNKKKRNDIKKKFINLKK